LEIISGILNDSVLDDGSPGNVYAVCGVA
jgi:hypothetical protein